MDWNSVAFPRGDPPDSPKQLPHTIPLSWHFPGQLFPRRARTESSEHSWRVAPGSEDICLGDEGGSISNQARNLSRRGGTRNIHLLQPAGREQAPARSQLAARLLYDVVPPGKVASGVNVPNYPGRLVFVSAARS